MKLICNERRCNWHGSDAEMLKATNPFDPEDEIVGCPECKSVDSLVLACDEPGCWEEVSCGAPVNGGYRQTCYKHMPKE